MADARRSHPSLSLPLPLATVLRDPVREQSVVRMWHAVEQRRRAQPAGRWNVIAWASLGAVVAVLAMFVARVTMDRPEATRVAVVADSGPLVTKDGSPVGVVDVSAEGPSESVSLSDGSIIGIAAGTRLEPLASSGREFIVRLAHGRATFDVKPGGPRRWVVEAGVASVEVVGTRFIVDREPSGVLVRVERGIVLVRGANVPDGVTRLEAGETTVVPGVSPPPAVAHDVAPEALDPEALEPDALEPENRPRAHRAAPSATADDWRARASKGDYTATYDMLGTEGLKREAERAKSADELFALADIARLSGHPSDAVAPLERLIAVYATSPRAPLASVTLGRILLTLGRPTEASNALSGALARGVPAGLEEDVYVRLVEALVKAGNPTRARAMAEAYERRFSNGRRQADIERWLSR